MSLYLEVTVKKQWREPVLDCSTCYPPVMPTDGTGNSKGENMGFKGVKSMVVFKVFMVIMVVWALAASAAESGAPPSGAGPAEVSGSVPPTPKGVVLSITFLGNKKFTSEQLQKVIDGTELKIGGPVGFTIIAPAMKALLEFYKKNNANLSISPNIIEDPRGIVFVQFIIDENGTKGDVGGLVSSGGPHIFCK
jgi:hypothetical protein